MKPLIITNCLTCNKEISYRYIDKRYGPRKFCNTSCASKYNNRNRVGKTLEELYGKERADYIKSKAGKYAKGKKLEEIFGELRAQEIRKKVSYYSRHFNGFKGKNHSLEQRQLCSKKQNS